MDELDRSLADLRRTVIDGAIRAGLERWAREDDPRQSSAEPASETAAARPPGARPGVMGRFLRQWRDDWSRFRVPVLVVLTVILGALLLL